jgi:hypothetical protein
VESNFEFSGGTKKRRGRKITPDITSSQYISNKPIKGEVGLINGQLAGSTLEWHLALGLWRAKFQFGYQVPVGGGSLFRGGLIIDFVVYTVPMQTPLEALGDYWHGGVKDDIRWREARMKRLMGNGYADPLFVWEHQAIDADMAYNWVRRNLR